MELDDEFKFNMRRVFSINEYEFKVWKCILENRNKTLKELRALYAIPNSRYNDIIGSLLNKNMITMIDISPTVQMFNIQDLNVVIKKKKEEILKEAEKNINLLEKYKNSEDYKKIQNGN